MPDTPRGNNKLGAFAAFAERTYYAKYAYPLDVPPPINLWDKAHQLYGKVDWHRNILLVREDTLQQLPSATQTLFALNYVVDAFFDLKEYYEKAAAAGVISSQSFILMRPKRAWTNIHDAFHEYSQSLYSIFVANYLTMGNVADDITSFSKFIKHFLRFISSTPSQVACTRSSFIYSKMAAPSTTGLFIELAKEKHDDDQIKYDKFIQDQNFKFYADAAKRFGFLIDKNAPWRLVADVRSPRMQTYMARYAVAPEDMFNNYYFYACDHDIDGLKMYFKVFYETFILQNPTVSKLTQKNGATCTSVIKRAPIAESEMNELADEMWLRVYTYLRVGESGANWTQQKFERKVAATCEYYKKNNLQKTQRYVSLEFRGCASVTNTKKDLTNETIGGIVKLPIRKIRNPLVF